MSNQGINIKISTSAQLAALKQTEQELIKQITAARSAGKSIKDLGAQTKQLAAVQGQMKGMGFSRRLLGEMGSMTQSIPVLGRVMTAANGGVGILSMGLAALTGAAIGARAALSAFSRMEDLQTTFVTLLGSVDAAKERMAELSRFAAETPFALPEIAQASKVLEGLTGGALSTGNGLRLVGDVAAATGANFGDMAVTVGRLYQGLRDGTPVGEAAARMTELTGINLRNATSWAEVEAALAKFNGEMERRSGTISGKESTLGDSMNMLMVQMGRPIAPAWKGTLTGVTSVLEGMANAMTKWNDAYDAGVDFRSPLNVSAPTPSAPVAAIIAPVESVEDRSKRMADALKSALAPLDEMGSAADRTARRLDMLRSAQEKLASALIDQDEAAGNITPDQAEERRVKVKYEADSGRNAADLADAQARLAATEQVAADGRKRTDAAMMQNVFQPTGKTQGALADAMELQAGLDQAVADAQAAVDALATERAAIVASESAAMMKLQKPDGPEWDATAQAQVERNKQDAADAASRKEFDADLAISEAEASGDDGEASRLKWNRDRAKLEAELAAMGDADSWGKSARMTDAQLSRPERAMDPSIVSALRAMGGAGMSEAYRPENQAAVAARAMVAEVKISNGHLQKLVSKPPVKIGPATFA